MQNLLENYFTKTLGVSFFAILNDGTRVDSSPGLKTHWSSRPLTDAITIADSDGNYTGMRAYAYHKGIPLWITAEDQDLVGLPDATLKDAWSSASSLPPYLERDKNGEITATSDAKTAVLVPLQYGERVFGVLILEFDYHFEHSTSASQEIKIIADALARIVWLNMTTNSQIEGTRRAVRQLEELFNANARPLTKPKLFVASATNADDAVMGCMVEVLGKFSNRVEITYWSEISKHGNINRQIVESITTSEFGVCYISELNNDSIKGALPYRDNPNVLFEAGMFQALMNDPAALLAGWIPIREHEDLTGPIPFDFAQERMIIVPRSQGTTNKPQFADNLRTMIDDLVGHSG